MVCLWPPSYLTDRLYNYHAGVRGYHLSDDQVFMQTRLIFVDVTAHLIYIYNQLCWNDQVMRLISYTLSFSVAWSVGSCSYTLLKMLFMFNQPHMITQGLDVLQRTTTEVVSYSWWVKVWAAPAYALGCNVILRLGCKSFIVAGLNLRPVCLFYRSEFYWLVSSMTWPRTHHQLRNVARKSTGCGLLKVWATTR